MISDIQKSQLESLILSTFDVKSLEARLIIDHIDQMAEDILRGTKPEKMLSKVARFVDQYRADLSILEQKRKARERSSGQRKKKKTQLDMFGDERHE